jgi:hypothetical protein
MTFASSLSVISISLIVFLSQDCRRHRGPASLHCFLNNSPSFVQSTTEEKQPPDCLTCEPGLPLPRIFSALAFGLCGHLNRPDSLNLWNEKGPAASGLIPRLHTGPFFKEIRDVVRYQLGRLAKEISQNARDSSFFFEAG